MSHETLATLTTALIAITLVIGIAAAALVLAAAASVRCIVRELDREEETA